jgi:hypothetical protein
MWYTNQGKKCDKIHWDFTSNPDNTDEWKGLFSDTLLKDNT